MMSNTLFEKQNKQAGFGIFGLIAILALVIVLGAAGWLVYKNRQDKNDTSAKHQAAQSSNKDASTQNTTKTDPSAKLKSYRDDNVSFQYPGTWKVEDMSHESGPKRWVQLLGPVDEAIAINKGLPDTSNRHLVIDINPLSSAADCRESCTVYDVTTLTTPKSNSRLVISDWDSQGSAQELEVVDHDQAMLGAEKYKLGATVNGRQVRVYGSVYYDKDTSSGAIDDVVAFKQTTSFQDLIKILNTLQVQE